MSGFSAASGITSGLSSATISPSMGLGTALMSILMTPDIQPGSEPSYQLCKLIYSYHPLGAKMVDSPIKMAQSQPRSITVEHAPERVVEKFIEQWKADKADKYIRNTARTARMYGIASLVVGIEGEKNTAIPIDPDKLDSDKIFFNVADPLNTAGSLVLNQIPTSADFQKVVDITIQGQTYHRSRTCVIMNEEPIYIEYTSAAFGFVGRSVYQRALYPLKTFIQSMITDNMVTRKAGLLIAKMKSPGSIIDNVMKAVKGVFRTMLQQGQTEEVLSVGHEDSIETLNMQNLDGAAGFARTNVLKNIATSADMPAVMLENETLVSGFGEGSEDAKIIAGYVEGMREWLDPLYVFMDPIVQRRAWNEEFYETIKRKFPDQYKGVPYTTAFQEWSNAFKYEWPSLLREPESEKAKVEDVKLKGAIATLEVLAPILDPDNKASLIEWFENNVNESKLMFQHPMLLDYDALRDYVPPELATGDTGAGQEPRQPKPFAATA